MMTMTTNSNIFFVANLQVYARPFTSLYFDKERGVLCLFVRISGPDITTPQFFATEVTTRQIDRYMKRRLGLKTIFRNNSCYLAKVNDMNVELEVASSYKPTREMQLSNMFDPEFCYDSMKLKAFLRRFENNQFSI